MTRGQPSHGARFPRRAFYRWRPCNLVWWLGESGIPRLDLLKALGDNTRYAIYLELARSPTAAGDGRHRRLARPAPQHGSAPPRAHAGGRPAGGLGRGPHRGRPAAEPLRARATSAPSLGLEPPTFPLLARMLVRLAEVTGATPEDAAEIGREQGRATPCPTPTPRRASRRWSTSSTASASIPPSTARTTRPRSSRSPTARSGSWPRPIRTSSARCTGAWSRASSTPWATPRSRSSTRWSTASPARSPSRPGNLFPTIRSQEEHP